MPAKYKKTHPDIIPGKEYPFYGIVNHIGHNKDSILSEQWFIKGESGDKIEIDKKNLEIIERF